MTVLNKEMKENNRVELTIRVERQEWQKALDDAYQANRDLYPVDGCAPGKATRRALEQAYAPDVFYQEAVNETFPRALVEAFGQEEILVAGAPELRIVDIGPEGFTFAALAELYPEVKLGKYKGLAAPMPQAELSNDDVDKAESEWLQAHLVEEERDRAAMGDEVTLDFDGSVDGVPFDGGKAENYPLLLGSGYFIPGFEDQLVGATVGQDVDVNVTFPEEYQAAELAGKAAVFKIKLHEVKYKELPALDDELAKDCSEYDTLDEFKASIRKNNQEQLDKQDDLAVENALVDQVIDGMEAEIPQAMYDVRMDELVNDFAFRMEQQGLRLEDYLKYMGQSVDQFRASFMPQAEKQVKIRLALEAVAAAENIEASEDELNAEVKRIADQYKMEEDKVRELINVDEVKHDLAINKAIDFIKSHANVVEKAAEAEKTEDAQ